MGIYLTLNLPIISGNTRPHVWFAFTFFRNNVKVDPVFDMVTRKSAKLGSTRATDMSSAQLPILWYKSVTVTANSTR